MFFIIFILDYFLNIYNLTSHTKINKIDEKNMKWLELTRFIENEL
jgi:hypothetical protein